jgi:hypothetical protein
VLTEPLGASERGNGEQDGTPEAEQRELDAVPREQRGREVKPVWSDCLLRWVVAGRGLAHTFSWVTERESPRSAYPTGVGGPGVF